MCVGDPHAGIENDMLQRFRDPMIMDGLTAADVRDYIIESYCDLGMIRRLTNQDVTALLALSGFPQVRGHQAPACSMRRLKCFDINQIGVSVCICNAARHVVHQRFSYCDFKDPRYLELATRRVHRVNSEFSNALQPTEPRCVPF